MHNSRPFLVAKGRRRQTNRSCINRSDDGKYTDLGYSTRRYIRLSVQLRRHDALRCAFMATVERAPFLTLLSFLLVTGPTGATFVSPLKLLLMVASGSNPNSSAVESAVNQTLDEINADNSILPGHRLDYLLRVSEVCITTASF